MNHYMGVDIGTSGCKAAAFDATGRQVALAYREYDLIQPQAGWAELDSDEVMEKCFDTIREIAGAVSGIRGVGISSQGEAITPMLSGRPGPRVRSSFTKAWLVCQTRSLRPSGA